MELARQTPPDMIISDILMPVMDGYKLCHQVKQDTVLREIPFVFYSGYFVEPKDKTLGMEFGGITYIDKPMKSDDFVDIVNQILRDYQTKKLNSPSVSLINDRDLFNMYEDNVSQKLYSKIQQLELETKTLKESEERYKSIINDVIDLSQVGICILDSDFSIVWINPSFETYMDLDRDKVIGMSKRELITTKIGNIFYDSKSFISKVLATYDNNTYAESFQCHVRAGHRRKERWLEHWSKPITSGLYAGGRIEHYYDITERKQAEEKLTKRNKDLKILNKITQVVYRSLSLSEVYKIALDEVINLENVDMAMIYLVDETNMEAILHEYRNLPEDYILRAGRIPYPKGITWKVIRSGKLLNIPNMEKYPGVGQAGRDLGHHGILGVPVKSGNKVIGVIWLLSYKERKFDKEEVRLLFSIGNQIASAIAKANLYKDLSKKNRYELIIRAVSQSVHSSLDLQEVLDNAVDSMNRNIDSADNISIYMVEDDVAVLKAYKGYPGWFIDAMSRLPYPKGISWKTITDGKPLYCPDIERDTIISSTGRKVGTKSYVSMPIEHENKVIGCIIINSLTMNAFSNDELELLTMITLQIQSAINNAKFAEVLTKSESELRKGKIELEERVKERTFELSKINELLGEDIKRRKRIERKLENSEELLRRLAARLEAIREEELSRISLEIHDDLGQKLTVLKMDLSWLYKNFTKLDKVSKKTLINKILDMINLVDSTIDTVRDILKGLSPIILDSLGLTAATEWQVQDFQNRTGIKTSLFASKKISKIEKNVSTAVFRILQESLNNILRHSEATEVSVSLLTKSNKLILEVLDNGIGFIKKDINDNEKLGLIGIRERVIPFEGTVNIKSIPGRGTKIRISIPITNQNGNK